MSRTPTEIKNLYDEHFGKSNFITPDVIRYGSLNRDYAYELSTGWFMNDKMWGVTVVRIYPNKIVPQHGISESFFKADDAEEYIATLKKMQIKSLVKMNEENDPLKGDI